MTIAITHKNKTSSIYGASLRLANNKNHFLGNKEDKSQIIAAQVTEPKTAPLHSKTVYDLDE